MFFPYFLGQGQQPKGWGGFLPIVHADDRNAQEAVATVAGRERAAAEGISVSSSGGLTADPTEAVAAGASAALGSLLPAVVADNQFFTGGLGLAAMGFAASLATLSLIHI